MERHGDLFSPLSNDIPPFGKNSDRPCDEVQEVVYFPAAVHDNLKEHLKVGEILLILQPYPAQQVSFYWAVQQIKWPGVWAFDIVLLDL